MRGRERVLEILIDCGKASYTWLPELLLVTPTQLQVKSQRM
jgi:hypothetical protein